MRSIVLAKYLFLRIVRRRAVWIALVGLPLAIALVRAAFAGSNITLACAWSCPLACAILTGAVVGVQRSIDRMSGLEDALISSPLGGGGVLRARVMLGVLIYIAQMLLLGAILAVRF